MRYANHPLIDLDGTFQPFRPFMFHCVLLSPQRGGGEEVAYAVAFFLLKYTHTHPVVPVVATDPK